MIDLSLSNETKYYIGLSTGIPFSEIEKLDAESIDRLIEKKNNMPLRSDYSKRDSRLPARGSIFLILNRYVKMSEVDKKLSII